MIIREILRLSELGLSQRDIAQCGGCAKSTVGDVLKRCKEAGLDHEKAISMDPDDLQKMLYPASADKAPRKPEPDWQAIHQEITRHKGMNIQYIWEEYRKADPEGLGYSQFCERYRRYRKVYGKGVTMYQERQPGELLEVDWMGDLLPCVMDSETGEVTDAHFFVSVLGASAMPFVRAYPDETRINWIDAHVRALAFYSGVPRIIRPDNCKTAIKRPTYREPLVNTSYGEFAAHYGAAIVPARVKRPRDKSMVENSVGWLETWLLNSLRGQIFYSFDELNKATEARMAELVQRPFQKRDGSRLSIFNEIDKPALKPLPIQPYVFADVVMRRVTDSYTVEYKKFYYSVPYTLHKQMVVLRATSTDIEILDLKNTRVAIHVRRYGYARRYSILPEHMPPSHAAYQMERKFDGDRYREWAGSIGGDTYTVIDTMLISKRYEEEAYRSCMGILNLTKSYGSNSLERACREAVKMDAYSFMDVEAILKRQKAEDAAKQYKPTPKHENIRGGSAYN